jgi:hypothetical protein
MDFTDALNIAPNHVLESDICIVGGGAVGITIAKEFIGTKFQVLILESGGFSSDEKTQSLYEVENVGHSLRLQKGYVSRNRFFGGSTNTWAGRCAPLNEIDFEKRDWIDHSGWPFGKSELVPFYKRACAVLNLPSYDNFNPDIWQNKILKRKPNFLYNDEVAVPEVFLNSRQPINMASSYKKELLESPNVKICINANVTEIESNQSLSSVKRLHVKSFAQNLFFAQAKIYILACGGWENARLLLVSQRYSPNGLGNQYDLVGRYYMEHPKVASGTIYPTSISLKSPIFSERILIPNGTVQIGIRLSDKTQREEKLLNHYLQFFPGYPEGTLEAYDTLITSIKKIKNLDFSKSLMSDLRECAPHTRKILNYVGHKINSKFLGRPSLYRGVSIYNHFEQVPNPESRVMLSNRLVAE